MADGVKGTIIAGVFAVAGGLGGAAVTGWSQLQLARQEFNTDLVLRALESADPEERLESLHLLVETNLLQDPAIQKGVRDYAKSRAEKPETIPQISASQTPSLAAPIVSDARIFLLAGAPAKESLFAEYREHLLSAGFRVLDAKVISDAGRPSHPEVRYFYSQDAQQAEALAEFVRFRLSDDSTEAKLYEDARVRPGYVELWFGD